MPVVNLTARFVESAKPVRGSRQTDFFDDTVRGLCLCASSGGTKTWFLHFTKPNDGRRARLKLGGYPELGLAAARQKARDARGEIGEGHDPAAAKRADAASLRVRDLVESYIQRGVATKRTKDEIARRLRKNVVERIGDIKVSALHRRDFAKCIDAVKDRGAHAESNRVYEDCRAMVRWARGRGDLDENLLEAMPRPAELTVRDRVLSADELRHFWTKLPEAKMQESTRRILRLCLLLGARVGEVSGMTRDEVEVGLQEPRWIIPARRSKNNRDHFLPISRQAVEIITDQLATIDNDCPWIFPNPSATAPITNMAVAKAIARSMATFGIEHFTAHDLRRSFASHTEALGVSPFIIGHVLNHASVIRATITSKVYARYDYRREKAECLTIWADHLGELIAHGGGANVVPLHRV
jgi:integrase